MARFTTLATKKNKVDLDFNFFILFLLLTLLTTLHATFLNC